MKLPLVSSRTILAAVAVAMSATISEAKDDSKAEQCPTRELDSIALTYASYGSSFSARLQHNDFFAQGFPISGSGEVRWNGQSAIVNRAVGGA